MRLKNESNLLVAQGGEVFVVEMTEILIIEDNLAPAWAVECAHDIQQRAFARARRTYNLDGFACLDREGDVSQDSESRSAFCRRKVFAYAI